MKYEKPCNETDPNAGYKDFNLETGEPGSIPPAAAIEMPQREIVAAIVAAGLVPSGEDGGQLAQAIAKNIGDAVLPLAPKAMFQVVSALPASPDPDVYYFIPE